MDLRRASLSGRLVKQRRAALSPLPLLLTVLSLSSHAAWAAPAKEPSPWGATVPPDSPWPVPAPSLLADVPKFAALQKQELGGDVHPVCAWS